MVLLGALALLLPLFARAQLQPLPEALPCQYGVIGLRADPAGADTLQISRLIPGGPASSAGLLPGDLLLGALPYRLRTREELSRYIQSQAPGDSVLLLVQRQGQPLQVNCRVTGRRQLYSAMGTQGKALPALGKDRRRDALEKGLGRLLQRHQATDALDRLVSALALEDSSYGADCRLRAPRCALLRPLKTARVAGDLSRSLRAKDLDVLLVQAGAALDLPALPAAPPPSSSPSLEGQLAPFFRAGQLVREALAPLDSAQQQELRAEMPPLLELLSRDPNLDQIDNAQDLQMRRTLALAKAVELPKLFAAARQLAALCAPASLKKLKTAARSPGPIAPGLPPGISGDLRYAQPGPWGWIIVGDRGPNHYEGPIALVLDLGGDDTYALTDPPLAGLIIDYQGDDRYQGLAGAGLAGVSVLVDLQGDDQYQSAHLGQGAAFCGVGLLLDQEGNDTYQAGAHAQGAAFFGAGLLLDQAGDDRYAAAQRSQGFGSLRGVGLLRDQRGSDQYLADLQVPSSYADPGLYEGWSQGVGCGIRGYGEGGIGLLLDQEGDDQYQAGNFSQGAGYFFGLGLLEDQRGNDTYLGSRYAQGAAAHQAVGVLVDHRGDDRYLGRVAAAQGSGWDAAIGLLWDHAGDDQYRADDLSQGAGAMNGLGLLLDQGGKDTYQARSGQGEGGGLQYWGGRQAPNLSALMDWGGVDTYQLPRRRDGAEFSNPGLGFFEDRR